jgi:hypothetical protein
MMPEEMHVEDLPFESDFAARVLDRADAIVARRRRTRWAIAPVAVAAGFAAYTMWQMRPVPDAGRIPQEIASLDAGAGSRISQMEPLDLLFPSAAPLARFSDDYAGGGDVTEDDLVYFPDPEQDDIVDGS